MTLTGDNQVRAEEFVSFPLCQPPVQHTVTWDWTRVFTVKDRQLIVSATAGPLKTATLYVSTSRRINVIKQHIKSSVLCVTSSGMWKRVCIYLSIIQGRCIYVQW